MINWSNIKLISNKLPNYQAFIKANDVFCCTGITIKKLHKLEYTYSIQVAKIALANGASQFLLVSSAGADPDALFFYTRMKGELELAIKRLPYWAIHIFKPSVLLEENRDSTLSELVASRLAKSIDSVAGESLGKYRPVEAEVVAWGMLREAQRLQEGIFIYEAAYLKKLAVMMGKGEEK